MTRNSIREVILHLTNCSCAGWSWASSGSQSGCIPTDSVWIRKKRSFFGTQLADCSQLDTGELNVYGSLIHPVTVVRDLGVVLQSDLSIKYHVAHYTQHIETNIHLETPSFTAALTLIPSCLLTLHISESMVSISIWSLVLNNKRFSMNRNNELFTKQRTNTVQMANN